MLILPLESSPVMHLRPFLLAIVAAFLAAAVPAAAIVADEPSDICPNAANPCRVRSGFEYQVPGTNTTLDFGARAVVIEQGAKLELTGGAFSTLHLLAGSLALDPTALIVGRSGTIDIKTSGDVVIRRDGTRRIARIDVDDTVAPGLITIGAAGDVVIDGTLQARGSGNEGGAGEVAVSGRSVEVAGEILATGNKQGDGGTISLESSAGPISIDGAIDASGGLQGGFVSIDAAGGSFTTSRGLMADNSKIDIRATGSGGYGGEVEISATGDIVMTTPIRGSGSQGGGDDFGGDGGEVTIGSERSITLDTGTIIELHGAVPEGAAGGVTLDATLDIDTRRATITAIGQTDGFGGLFDANAQRDLVLGDIDLHCVGCLGGEITASAWCSLTVPADAILDARTTDGTIDLASGGSLVVDGRLRSARNALFHRTDQTPDLTGSVIEPKALDVPDDSLVPCGGFPTPDCGNGVWETNLGEECDDDNNESCDGCSSTCKKEECGNGRIDCNEVCDDGAQENECAGECAGDCMALFPVCGNGDVECDEEDDDGNRADCDGVSSTCMVEKCGNGIRECAEECDDAANPDCNVALCLLAPVNCGNDALDANELCDDGNTADCDGCSHLCTPEGCGNNVPETCPVGSPVESEECDDGNQVACGDDCTNDCRVVVCGDGIPECTEPCDEGAQNGQPGSTCIGVEDVTGTVVCQDGELCTPDSEGPCIPCGSTTECDPLNRCGLAACEAGVCVPVTPPNCNDGDACTADSCNPATGCVNENTCNDGDACTDDACDPDTGCSHTTVVCDDADVCTDESCDPASGCVRSERTSFAAVSCRLDTLQAILDAATEAELHKKARKKIGGFLKAMRTKLAAAESGVSSGRGRKVTKAMKAADKQVDKLGAFVTKQRGRRIGESLAGSLLDAIRDLNVRMRTLAASIVG